MNTFGSTMVVDNAILAIHRPTWGDAASSGIVVVAVAIAFGIIVAVDWAVTWRQQKGAKRTDRQ